MKTAVPRPIAAPTACATPPTPGLGNAIAEIQRRGTELMKEAVQSAVSSSINLFRFLALPLGSRDPMGTFSGSEKSPSLGWGGSRTEERRDDQRSGHP
jgi:hypothetical protein